MQALADTATSSGPLSESAGIARAQILSAVPRAPELGYGLYHVLAAYGQLALLAGLLPLLPPGAVWKAAFVLAIGWTQYRLYFPLHEACHGTLFASPSANRLIGRMTAGLLLTSFATFTAIHMQHHRLYGEPEDPGACDYYVHFRSRGAAWCFFLSPLLGLSLLEKVWTNLARPVLRFLRRAPAERAAGAPESVQAPAPLDLASLAAAQAAVFLALSGSGARPLDYVLFYLLPGATVFLFLARLRMYLEHGPVDYVVSDYLGANRRRIARTHGARGLARPLFSYMNFRFHWEHHLCPSLPSSSLPEVHRRFTRAVLPVDDYSPSYLATVRRLLHITDGM